MKFTELFERLFGVPSDAPEVRYTQESEVWDVDSEGVELEPREDTSDPSPVEIVVGHPVAVIQRPSRSWTAQNYRLSDADEGRTIQLANRNLYRVRFSVWAGPESSTTNAVLLLGASESSARTGAGMLVGATGLSAIPLTLHTAGEVWLHIESLVGSVGFVLSVVQEFEDGSSG